MKASPASTRHRPTPYPRSALVVFSGGQDSTTCLYWARRRFASVRALCFDYGQRHRRELAAARRIAALAGVPLQVMRLDIFRALGGNALIDPSIAIKTRGPSGLPSTFVPGRNLLFLTTAAAHAWQLGITDLVTGVCQTDYSGYPDCRENTMRALEKALSLGLGRKLRLHTPLMHLTKAGTVRLARRLGAMPALAHSHTCYQGARPPCGKCPACRLRAKGFREAGMTDPLLLS